MPDSLSDHSKLHTISLRLALDPSSTVIWSVNYLWNPHKQSWSTIRCRVCRQRYVVDEKRQDISLRTTERHAEQDKFFLINVDIAKRGEKHDKKMSKYVRDRLIQIIKNYAKRSGVNTYYIPCECARNSRTFFSAILLLQRSKHDFTRVFSLDEQIVILEGWLWNFIAIIRDESLLCQERSLKRKREIWSPTAVSITPSSTLIYKSSKISHSATVPRIPSEMSLQTTTMPDIIAAKRSLTTLLPIETPWACSSTTAACLLNWDTWLNRWSRWFWARKNEHWSLWIGLSAAEMPRCSCVFSGSMLSP